MRLPTYIQSLTKSCPHHVPKTIITQLQHQSQHQLQHQFQQLQHQLQHDQVAEVRNKLSDSAMDNMQSRR